MPGWFPVSVRALPTRRRAVAALWAHRRAITLTVLGWQATYATLGAIASERSALSLVALVLALSIAVGVGATVRRRGAVAPMWLGAGYTALATIVFAVAVPLGALGPVPSSDAYGAVPWRVVASVMYFALFAGLPCFGLAAWTLLTTDSTDRLDRIHGEVVE